MPHPPLPSPAQDLPVKRLLQIAVEVFAEQGFRDATIREICTRANVNVAAVNYYFRSKQGLYAEALNFAFAESNKHYPQNAAQDKSSPPEQRLAWFIDNFLHKLLDDSRLGLHSTLIAREIAEPTQALDTLIATSIAPQCGLLADIIQDILGPAADNITVQRCVMSILGQCLMFKHSRTIIDRLFPGTIADLAAIKASSHHIAKFSLAALHQLKPATGKPL